VECEARTLDGSVLHLSKDFGNSTVEAWGNHFTQGSPFTVHGSFAEELSAYLEERFLKSAAPYAENAVAHRGGTLCDAFGLACFETQYILQKPSTESRAAVICNRWTDPVPGSNIADAIVSDDESYEQGEERLRQAIERQLVEGTRTVFAQFCSFLDFPASE
jgi:hypothetical protein